MQVAGDTANYRLLGDWADRYTTAAMQPRTEQWWLLTGHTLPHVDADGGDVVAPYQGGCDHAPAFYVDDAVLPNGWLWDLLGMLPGWSPASSPTPAMPAHHL